MKICTAQINPLKGDIERNVGKHIKLIDLAASYGADMISFPELSLTGYEPKLAKALVTDLTDRRLDGLQQISDLKNITIGVGLPTNCRSGIHISMVIIQPNRPRQAYSKQHLHDDESPYFVHGHHQVFLEVSGRRIAPAICYESLLPEHSENAFKSGAEIYLASVAKSANGVSKAQAHYPEVAKKYSMTVVMSNCVGPCDDFESAGQSAIWNDNGELIGQLDETNEGILIVDTDTGALIKKTEIYENRKSTN